MRLLKSFSTKMTAITLVLFLLFCAVSTVSWYYNFTQEATITAEENIGAVIKALSSNFEANLRDIDYVTALVSNKVHTSSNDCLIRYLTAEDDDMAFVSYLQESQKYLSNRCSFKTYLNGLAVYNFRESGCLRCSRRKLRCGSDHRKRSGLLHRHRLRNHPAGLQDRNYHCGTAR